jgi:hypothetical protein
MPNTRTKPIAAESGMHLEAGATEVVGREHPPSREHVVRDLEREQPPQARVPSPPGSESATA